MKYMSTVVLLVVCAMAFAIEDLNGNEAVLITRYGPSYQNYVSAYGSASAGAYGSASSFAGSYPHGVSISSAFPGTYATSFASSYPSSYNYGSYPSYNRKVYGAYPYTYASAGGYVSTY